MYGGWAVDGPFVAYRGLCIEVRHRAHCEVLRVCVFCVSATVCRVQLVVLSALASGKGHQSIPQIGPPAEKVNPDLVGLNRPTLSARQVDLKKWFTERM